MAKVLIVDDEKHIRTLYKEELEDEGYEVTTEADAHKLIERVARDKPDLLVLDIKMPGYNGLDLLQDIRNQFYDLPVVLCSAYDTFKRDIKSIAADFYVVKSSNLSQLKRTIARALESTVSCIDQNSN